MDLRRNRLMRLALVAVFTLTCFTSPAFAAKKEDPQPPFDVTGLTHSKVWVPWVCAFLFAGGCVAAAFKNPHRSTNERD
jgi:hypothetical protein